MRPRIRALVKVINRWRGKPHPAADERQSAFGLWRYAFEYLKASKTLDEGETNRWVASSVTYQCACQGIELAFKSYLRAKGHSVRSLQRLGHSLIKCRRKATAHGLRPRTAPDSNAIRMIDRYYRAQEFRYIVTGAKQYPEIGELERAGAVLLDDVVDDVASAMGSPELAARMKQEVSATFGHTKG